LARYGILKGHNDPTITDALVAAVKDRGMFLGRMDDTRRSNGVNDGRLPAGKLR
jgi:hypothetical protein